MKISGIFPIMFRFDSIGLGDQLLFISFDVKVKKFWGASGKGWPESVHLGWDSVI